MSDNTDKWIEWYKGFRGSLVTSLGAAGMSGATGSPMPRLTWVGGLSVCTYIAMELAKVIDMVNERERTSVGGYSLFWATTVNREPTSKLMWRAIDARTFLAGFPLVLGVDPKDYSGILSEALAGKPLSKIWYTKFTAQEIADCDPTKRICAVNGTYEICSIQADPGTAEYAWMAAAIRDYNTITSIPGLTLNSTDNLPGVGNLKLSAVEMVMSAVYHCCLDMATYSSVPTVSWSDVGGAIKNLSERAISAGAETIGRGIGWGAEQLGRGAGIAAASALDETGLYGLALLGIGAYIVVG